MDSKSSSLGVEINFTSRANPEDYFASYELANIVFTLSKNSIRSLPRPLEDTNVCKEKGLDHGITLCFRRS
jgi:hypothetical protein